jgi:hypothetical protein
MPPDRSPPTGGAGFFSGLSAMTASVVRNRAAIEAPFCSAERVTLDGSMMPALIRSLVLTAGRAQALARAQPRSTAP